MRKDKSDKDNGSEPKKTKRSKIKMIGAFLAVAGTIAAATKIHNIQTKK